MKKHLALLLVCCALLGLAAPLAFAENAGVAPDLVQAAEAGDAEAMYSIGELYYYGDGVEQDYAQAMAWYQKAAELGDAKAMNNIGALYYNGWGVRADRAQAKEWFQRAADAGNELAKENLAKFY